MESDSHTGWRALLAGGTPHSARRGLSVRVLKKQNEPWLLLPKQRACAVTALSLYPAQRPSAKFAKLCLHYWLKAGLPLGGEHIKVAADDPFSLFLRELTGHEPIPSFALLAGNPTAPGRRFVLLVFDSDDQPCAVVKAGIGRKANNLIAHEAAFLGSMPQDLPGMPRLIKQFGGDSVSAFATDYITGDSPRQSTPAQIRKTLSGWIDSSTKCAIAGLPQWERLTHAVPRSSPMFDLMKAIGRKQVHPVLAHGDFVPWNIKVQPDGGWTVLDWERGEQLGIPGWDWFHYAVQTGILVDRLTTEPLHDRLRTLIRSSPFKSYAGQSGIEGSEGQLLTAYLLHAVEILKPAGGIDMLKALLDAWLSATREPDDLVTQSGPQ